MNDIFSSSMIFSFLVLPQPVYMNMGDLALMAAQKAQQNGSFNHGSQGNLSSSSSGFPPGGANNGNGNAGNGGVLEEDSPELKTPTAEDMNTTITGTKVSNSFFIQANYPSFFPMTCVTEPFHYITRVRGSYALIFVSYFPGYAHRAL